MYTIIGKRWFNRRCGNTYHSTEVLKDGVLVGKVELAYGYGCQYLQTALAIMQQAGDFPITGIRLASGISKDTADFFDAIMDKSRFVLTVSDVARKMDL